MTSRMESGNNRPTHHVSSYGSDNFEDEQKRVKGVMITVDRLVSKHVSTVHRIAIHREDTMMSCPREYEGHP